MLLGGFALWRLDLPFDRPLLDSLRLDAGNPLVPITSLLTTLGGSAVLIPLALLVIAWLLVQRRAGLALWLLVTIGSGRLAVEAMKLLFARDRPPLPDRLAEVSSHSFPSSHAAGAMLTALALAMVLPARRRVRALPLAFAAGLAVGWSRMALGVHWPSDVIAGFGLAILWVGVARYSLPQRTNS